MIISNEKNVLSKVPIVDDVMNDNVTDVDDNIINYHICAATNSWMMIEVLRMNKWRVLYTIISGIFIRLNRRLIICKKLNNK